MLHTELRLAGLNLFRQRKRTLLSLAAIIVGVAGYCLAGGFIEWIFWAIRETTIQTGLGHIQITARGYRDTGDANPQAFRIHPDDALKQRIEAIAGVATVARRLETSGMISSGEKTVPFVGEGVEASREAPINAELKLQGRRLQDGDARGVLLGRGLARALDVKVGDRVVFLASGRGGGIRGTEGIVRGIFATEIKAYDDVAVRLPLAMAQELVGTRDADLWVVGLADTSLTDDVVRRLAPSLAAAGLEERSWLDLSDFYRKSVALLSRQMTVVGALIAAILVLGIANLMTMSALERTGEIGTMLALGTTRGSVARMILVEGLLVGVLGAVAGILIGYLLAAGISSVGIPMPPPPGRDTGYRAEILVTVPVVIVAAGIAIASAAAAGLYPAWRTSRMAIVDALRHNR